MTKRVRWALGLVFCCLATAAQAAPLKETDGFARYKFNSVHVSLSTPQEQTISGATVSVTATIENTNSYPIVDGMLYVKVFHPNIQDDEDVATPPNDLFLRNGYPVVDQFVAVQDIQLNAREKKQVQFEYAVPTHLMSGDYLLSGFFSSAGKFNLQGLSFTDDVVGDSLDLAVVNEEISGSVEFDKNSVTLNGQMHRFVGGLVQFSKEAAVTVNATIKNTTAQEQEVAVSWDMYSWDSLRENNAISKAQETLILAAGESKILTHTVEANSKPVNYLVVKADWQDTRSILDIRFARTGDDEPRNNFMGLSDFPFKANQPVTLFATAHLVTAHSGSAADEGLQELMAMEQIEPTDETNSSEHKVMLSLYEGRGTRKKPLASFVYQGSIPSKVTGYEANYTPEKAFGVVTLVAEIMDQQGKVIDQTELVYDCAAIDPGRCPAASGTLERIQRSATDTVTLVLVILCGLSIVGGAGYLVYVRNGKRNDRRTKKNSTRFTMFVIGILAVLASPVYAEEREKVSIYESNVKNPMALKGSSARFDNYHMWVASNNTHWEVRYSASSLDTRQQVRPGQKFVVKNTTLSKNNINDSISWLSTGSSNDTPYGVWSTNAAMSIEPRDVILDATLGGSYRYVQKALLSFNPPKVTMVTTGPVKCEPMDNVRWTCTVTPDAQAGQQITTSLVYAATYGKYYYKSEAYNNGKKKNEFSGAFQDKLNCSSSGIYCGEKRLVVQHGVCSDVLFNACPKDGFPYGAAAWPGYCSTCDAPAVVRTNERRVNFAYIVAPPANKLPLVVQCVNDGSGTCPASLMVNDTGKFTFKTTDPDNDRISYQVDWNGDQITDVSSPVPVPSGQISSRFAKIWATPGDKTYYARACDTKGGCSPWKSFTVAVKQNTPPIAPQITGPQVGKIKTPYPYTLVATDGDGDQIRYGVDWNLDEVIDAWLPAGGGYVASGTRQSVSRQWDVPGQRTFQARTCDNRGACSGWRTYSVTISSNPPAMPTCPKCPPELQEDTNGTFPFISSDPDGDRLLIEIDWNKDNSIEDTSLLQPSPAAYTITKKWSDPGDVTYRARAKDATGEYSEWRDFTVDITACKSNFTYTCNNIKTCDGTHCGTTITDANKCIRTDANGCTAPTEVDNTLCGATCPKDVQCPLCGSSDWIEVNP